MSAEFARIHYDSETLHAYQITPDGHNALNNSYGNSSHQQLPRRIMCETLATATPDYACLRYRRAHIIKIISKKPNEIQVGLLSAKIDTSVSVIRNDIKGLDNIGLRIQNNGEKFLLKDIIIGLNIRKERIEKKEITEIKSRVIGRVKYINPSFFELIELSQ